MSVLFNSMLLAAGIEVTPLSYVATASASGNAANGDLTINKPAGTVSGDDMWAIIWDGTTTTGFTSSGWSLVNQVVTGSNRYSILLKTAGGSEPSSYVFTNPSSITKGGHIVTTRGGSKSTNVGSLTVFVGSNSIPASSISPLQAGILLALYSRVAASGSVSSGPAGMTQIGFENVNYSVAAYMLDPSPAGATGAKSITWNSVGSIGALLVQIY